MVNFILSELKSESFMLEREKMANIDVVDIYDSITRAFITIKKQDYIIRPLSFRS